MAKPKKIEPTAQYEIELAEKVKVGEVWLKPTQERIVVKGTVLDAIEGTKVMSAKLVEG